ncbi:MAG: TetR/AcrR family transcriptional regulator [Microbacterium gubbeenense]|uniref:TetR/AcrR family transcriptional regulator n=1 Tax=Microbacterium gubbeenense TaxID=159896 RepID=UPI003F9C50DF
MLPLRAEKRQATRSRVLNEARRLFEQRGFTATTIRDIAQASNVSVGTVMSAGDKPALLVQVFDDLIAAEHDARSAPPTAGTCVDRILSIVDPFVTIFTDRQDLARAYASILVSGTHSSTLFTKLASRLVDEIRAAIGGSDDAEAYATANAAYVAYIGTLFSWSARHGADSRELIAALRATFTTICERKS